MCCHSICSPAGRTGTTSGGGGAGGGVGGGGGERAVRDAEEVVAELGISQFVCKKKMLVRLKVFKKKTLLFHRRRLGFLQQEQAFGCRECAESYLATAASSCFWEQGETQGN